MESQNLDGLDGWAKQYNYGHHCAFLGLINSVNHSEGTVDLSEFMTVVSNEDGTYTVTLDKFNDYIVSKNVNLVASVTLTKSEIENNGQVFGDLDTKILDTAIVKLCQINYDTSYEYAWREAYNKVGQNKLISMLFYGTEKYHSVNVLNEKEDFLIYWDLYKTHKISAMPVSFWTLSGNHDYKSGLIQGHEYSIKDVNVEKEYVEFINPMDDKDVLRLPFDYLFESDSLRSFNLFFYGQSKTAINKLVSDYKAEHGIT